MAQPKNKIIDRLTDEQTERLPIAREQWLSRGLATGPTDRAAMEAAALAVYDCTGIERPPLIIWMGSPLGGMYACTVLQQMAEKKMPPTDGGGQLGDQLRGQLGDQLWDQLWDQLGGQLWDQLGVQLRDQLWVQLGGQLGGQLRDQLYYGMYGQHDIPWIGFYDFIRSIGAHLDDKHSKWLDSFITLADGGWWWGMRGALVLTDRPIELHRDAQGRLHNERGVAIGYSDAWGVHAIHGVRVPEQVITHPETLTIEQILGTDNTEIRRVMCEKYGWDRFVTHAKLTLIDECDDPANFPNTIRLYDLPRQFQVFGTPVRLYIVVNATPERDGTIRTVGLTCPVEIKKAIEAPAWSFGVDAKTYRQLERAT